MDTHHVLAHQSILAMRDAVAFSALPNAPVLGDRPGRRARLAAAWRARRAGSPQTPSLRRPVAVVASAKVASRTADDCRMVA